MRTARPTKAPASSTGTVIGIAAQYLSYFALERNNLVDETREALSIEAAVFRAVTGRIPAAFTKAPDRAELLIATNETAQDAFRWISAVLPTDAPHDPDTGIDDHLEHIRIWVSTKDFFTGRLPEPFAVAGVLLRAQQAADSLTEVPTTRAAASAPRTGSAHTDEMGFCLTCGGHGTVQGEEVPYGELRPRQQQGHDHGRRYYRSAPCARCDAQDHATPAAEAQIESAA